MNLTPAVKYFSKLLTYQKEYREFNNIFKIFDEIDMLLGNYKKFFWRKGLDCANFVIKFLQVSKKQMNSYVT